MITVDTSLVVALFASWHEAHEVARSAVPRGIALPAHVALESYSVLTRLPPPHRAPAGVVSEFLTRRFGDDLLTLPADLHFEFLESAVGDGLTGGAIYDALIGATARHAGATLLTRDRRAARTYDAVRVTYQMVG